MATSRRGAGREATARRVAKEPAASSATEQQTEITRGDRPLYVYERVRDLIVRGVLGPGARLVENDIASRFGVSRTPVTLALKRLEQEGYVVGASAAHSRASVAPLTKGDATELFRIVGELEGIAAENAAMIAAPERRALAKELQVINAQLQRASEEGRHADPRLNELDEQLHRRLVEAGAGPRLIALHDRIKPQVKRYTRIYVSMLPSEVHLSVAEHDAIIRALAAGNVDRTRTAVHTNWRRAAERLARVIESVGERSW